MSNYYNNMPYGYQQPSYQQPQQQPPESNKPSIIQVAGVQGAHLHQMPNGSQAIMLDTVEKVAYIKQVSDNGETKVDAYQLVAIPEFNAKTEIDALKNNVDEIKGMLASISASLSQQSTPQQPTENHNNHKGGRK